MGFGAKRWMKSRSIVACMTPMPVIITVEKLWMALAGARMSMWLNVEPTEQSSVRLEFKRYVEGLAG